MRRAGAMSVHQMVCHLNDSYKIGLGEKYASPATGFFSERCSSGWRWTCPCSGPRDFATRPEMEQGKGGSLRLISARILLVALHPGPVLRCLAHALRAASDIPGHDSEGLDALGISARGSSPAPVWPMNAAPAVPSARHPRRVLTLVPYFARGVLAP